MKRLIILAASLISLLCLFGPALAEGKKTIGIIYQEENNRFFAVHSAIDSTGNTVHGQYLKFDGTPVGAPIKIYSQDVSPNPVVVAVINADPILVVFEYYTGPSDRDIYGQFIKHDGSLGSQFMIAGGPGNQSAPTALYLYDPRRSGSGTYLVAWSDERNGPSDIYGQFLDSHGRLQKRNGQPGSENFVLSGAPGNQERPVISPLPESTNQDRKYLLAWKDCRSGAGCDIYGQLINSNGYPQGQEIIISDAANNQSNPSMSSMSLNPQRKKLLIVWEDARNGATADIYGQFMDPEGRLVKRDGAAGSDSFMISGAADSQANPSVFYNYNYSDPKFIVAWQDFRNGSHHDIYARHVNMDGALSGTDFVISNASGNQFSPVMIHNRLCNNVVLAYRTPAASSETIGSNVLGAACAGSPPRVTKTSPIKEQQAPSSSASVTFDRAMMPISVNETTFLVTDSKNNPIKGRVSGGANGDVYTFYSAPFKVGETYIVKIARDVKERTGWNEMASDYVWSFNVTPEPVIKGKEITRGVTDVLIKIAPKGGGSAHCFIATAAYGSYLDPHVMVFRDFRDRHLLKNKIGASFVNYYYLYSPPIAAIIQEHESLRIITRSILTPLVYILKYPAFFISGLAFLAIFAGRKIAKKKGPRRAPEFLA